MQHVFSHRFTTSKGLLIYVPTEGGRALGERIAGKVLGSWSPPTHFYHFQDGGHVAAAKRHLNSTVFARLDIKAFYDSTTRSKVVRALQAIRIPHADALDIASYSTVKKPDGHRSLPFGFVQSPALASLALEKSALGKSLSAIASDKTLCLSVYMDDIIISGNNSAEVTSAVASLEDAAALSGFTLSASKRQIAVTAVEAFNLRLAKDHLEVTQARMTEFAAAEETASQLREKAIVGYVNTVNKGQANELADLFGLSGPKSGFETNQ